MDAIQRIALLSREAAHDADGRLLLYAEVEDGVISADLFSQFRGGPVRFRFAPAGLREAIYSDWEAAKDRWATYALLVENGRFSLSLQYEDSLKHDEALHDRRPRIVRAHFGDTLVDYSSPE